MATGKTEAVAGVAGVAGGMVSSGGSRDRATGTRMSLTLTWGRKCRVGSSSASSAVEQTGAQRAGILKAFETWPN